MAKCGKGTPQIRTAAATGASSYFPFNAPSPPSSLIPLSPLLECVHAQYPQSQVQSRCSSLVGFFACLLTSFFSCGNVQGNKSFVPFSNLSDGDSLTMTWKVR